MRYYSTKLSLRGKDLKSKENFSRKLDVLDSLKTTTLFKSPIKGPWLLFEET